MSIEITQRNVTNKQSTADYVARHGFLFDNKYADAVFNNNTAGALTLKPMTVVIRNIANGDQIIPAVTGATLANIVGITANDLDVELADGALFDMRYCHGGTINSDYLVLPAGVTLATVVGGKTVGDILKGIGFELESPVEHTKLDN